MATAHAPAAGASGIAVVSRDGEPPGWLPPLAEPLRVVPLVFPLDDDALVERLHDCVAAVIDAHVGAPVSIARRVHRAVPGAQLVIVAADIALEDLRRAMIFAPGVGEVWLVEPGHVTPELIERAASVGSSRRRHTVRSDRVARAMAALPRADDRRVVLADRYLATLLELLPDPVLALDDDDSVLFSNPAASALLGLSGDTRLPGAGLRERLAPSDAMGLDRLLRDGRAGVARAQLELAPAGTPATFDVAVAPVGGERPVRALLLHDVSEQVTARAQLEEQALELEEQRHELQARNEELRAQTDALERQSERNRQLAAERAAMLGQIAEGVIIVDRAGNIVFANEVARRLHGQVKLGAGMEDWADPFDLLALDGRPIAPSDLALARAFRNRETVTDAEWLIRRADGTTLRVLGSAAPVVDEGNRSLGAVLTMRDVTQQRAREEERERLLEERDRAVKELTAAMRHRSRFYASMSHELRTPINAIVGYNDLLLGEVFGALDGKQRTALERVQQAASHLLELVNDVLDLSKIEAGKLSVLPEPVQMRQLVDDLKVTMQPLADTNGVSLSFVLGPGSDEPFQTDPRRVRQILMNLISNAIRYGEGSPVEVRCAREEGMLRIDVEDRGPGIPPEELHRVFDEFVQVGDSERGGTGLGLAIGRALAQALGGALTAKSAVGRGSVFTLRIPELKEPVAGE